MQGSTKLALPLAERTTTQGEKKGSESTFPQTNGQDTTKGPQRERETTHDDAKKSRKQARVNNQGTAPTPPIPPQNA